ncbi:MAG TPA: hypothetical protein VFQ91_28040 [Bryobacteraceae bacterium]|nr:hypothetical protein [Bryobacteraceae bacterium]
MSGLIRKILACFVLFLPAAYAQNIGIGVRGGVPLTDFLHAESQVGAVTNVVKGRGNVIIGPMFEIRLPMGLGIEADALYRRWDAKGVLDGGSRSAWDFPIYGKARLPGVIVRPYVGAGVNFQRVGDLGRFLQLNSTESSRRGFLGAGGLEFKVPFVRVSPEIRYTRWNNAGPIRSANQLDFLIGLSF